jgi:hypothetical protein
MSLTSKDVKILLGVGGIAGVMTLMRLAGASVSKKVDNERALIYAAEVERAKAHAARAAELDRARRLTDQHLRMAVASHGVNPFLGESMAPMIMAASANQNSAGPFMPKDALRGK